MKTFISKFVAMPSNDEGVFMLVHITDTASDEGEDVASIIGPVVKETDEEGTYYVMPKTEETVWDATASTVLMAFHESQIEESEVAWEIFRDVIGGKLKMEEPVD
jgi:hypothetical protein